MLASGIHELEKLSLLLDIGTNTEVFIGNSDDILSCSCASGPAFEGDHIRHGVKAVTGAIERVSISQDYEVTYETIDDAAPIGICGSAMIDVMAELFKRGIINQHGRFNTSVKTSRLRKTSGELEFVLAWRDESGTDVDITITQSDINKLQLVKAAIFAGCSILMKRKNISLETIDRLLIAGSFGSYINPENAKIIGLIPDLPIEKIQFVGNTALSGAKMALISMDARKMAEALANKIRYLELAMDPDFHREFAAAAFIPHKDLDRFPSVKKLLE
ncbi:ATP-binding protein [Candidatus Bathyarchaeota archaeon]|nr:ATP-binding protein [Candidatus Bathyarchaeota archaeon]